MHPDSPLLDRVVHDSNNLGDPPQRRMNMSMVDNGGRRLEVLNATADETGRCIGASEVRLWRRLLRRSQLGLDAQVRVVAAVRGAAMDWFGDELERPDGFLRRVPLSEDEVRAAMELSLVLPEDLFTGRDGPRKEVDRAMVAEAAVTGRTLLLTEDEGTIRHLRTNRWLTANRWTTADTLLRSNALAHQRLEGDAGDRALYAWMLGGFLPDEPSGRDVDIIEYNAKQLDRAGMRYASVRVLQELHADPDPAGTFARTRANWPQRARATEARRVERVRAAAREAGYQP